MLDQKYAIVIVQERKTRGVRVDNEFIVVTAAADDKGSYGCEIWINMDTVMVKWGKTEKKKLDRSPKMSHLCGQTPHAC